MSRFPSADDFDAIVAMGGPMSVNDEDEHPWLRDEKRLIGDAVRAGMPFWGACLGVQLLAASLGARVYAGSEPEVGLLPVTLTDAGRPTRCSKDSRRRSRRCSGTATRSTCREDAVLLAGSAAYPHQAFRFERAYGIQFHLEVSLDMARAWADVPAYAESLDRVLGSGSLPALIDELGRRGPEMLDHGRKMFASWLDSMVGTRA